MSKFKIIERDPSDKSAIDVYGEAGVVFWKAIRDGNKLGGKMSIHQLRTLFDEAVIPAIKRVRELDREHQDELIE